MGFFKQLKEAWLASVTLESVSAQPTAAPTELPPDSLTVILPVL